MSVKPNLQVSEVKSQVEAIAAAPVSAGLARRRLLRAGLAAAPVVLAVSGRSAMATSSFTNCAKGLSPMAWNSLTANSSQNCTSNLSHTVNPNTPGLSPGYWKPNGSNANNCTVTGDWPTACIPYVGYAPGSGNISVGHAPSDAPFWATGTKFNAIFGGSDSRSVSQVLIDGNQGDANANWHLCAAILNAYTRLNYPLTVQEVKNLYAGSLGVTGQTLTFSQIKSYLDTSWT